MKPPIDLERAFSEVPTNRHLGFRLLARSAEEAEISMEVRPEFLQEGGVVHGGLISTLADTTAVYLFYPDLGDDGSITSIEFKVNFLRPTLAGKGSLIARARTVRRGERVGVADVTVFQADEAVAKGTFTYLLIDRER